MKTTALAYTPYGYIDSQARLATMLGFNGERLERHSETYLLGNGYRPYNPIIMRFLAPDSWSPFGRGGRNAYTYCAGDPINRLDPSGHVDFSGMRRVANSMRDRARAIETRRVQQQPAQQRVAELRQRLAQRQATEAPPAPNRNPLARTGGEHHYAQRDLATNTLGIHQRNHAGSHQADSGRPPAARETQMTADEAERLYDRLTVGLAHEQNYLNHLRYVAPGTEMRREYDTIIFNIREEIAGIRDRLGPYFTGVNF